MKNFKKLTALLLAVLTVLCMFTMGACGDTSWAAKYDDETVPAGIYPLAAMIAYQNVYSQYGAVDLTATMTNDEGTAMTVGDYINQSARETFEYYVATKAMYDELGLTYSEEDYQAYLEVSETYYNAQSSIYSANGISEESFHEFFVMNSLRLTALTEYFAELYLVSDSDYYVSDSDLKAYFDENYMRINYMLYFAVDDSGNYLTEDSEEYQAELAKLTNIVNKNLDADKFAAFCEDYTDSLYLGEVYRRNGAVNKAVNTSDSTQDTLLGDVYSYASTLEVGASGVNKLGFYDAYGNTIVGVAAVQRVETSINDDDYLEFKDEMLSSICSENLFADLAEYYDGMNVKENKNVFKTFAIEKLDLTDFTSIVPAE